jgi:hypothetical protein
MKLSLPQMAQLLMQVGNVIPFRGRPQRGEVPGIPETGPMGGGLSYSPSKGLGVPVDYATRPPRPDPRPQFQPAPPSKLPPDTLAKLNEARMRAGLDPIPPYNQGVVPIGGR